MGVQDSRSEAGTTGRRGTARAGSGGPAGAGVVSPKGTDGSAIRWRAAIRATLRASRQREQGQFSAVSENSFEFIINVPS